MEIFKRSVFKRCMPLFPCMQRKISTETQSHFPYIFKNDSDFLFKRDQTSAESVELMNTFLDDKEFRLREGFSMAYLSLLKSLQANTVQDVGSFCERNLYRAFSEGLQDINSEVQGIEILNENRFPKNCELRVIDYD